MYDHRVVLFDIEGVIENIFHSQKSQNNQLGGGRHSKNQRRA